jgi:hypothetical protein
MTPAALLAQVKTALAQYEANPGEAASTFAMLLALDATEAYLAPLVAEEEPEPVNNEPVTFHAPLVIAEKIGTDNNFASGGEGVVLWAEGGKEYAQGVWDKVRREVLYGTPAS